MSVWTTPGRLGRDAMASRCRRHTRVIAGLVPAILLLMLALPAGPVRAAPLVMNCNDGGSGSLRAAITAATSGDTIQFQAGLNCPSATPIKLTSGALSLTRNLTIDGTGATIAVDGNRAVTVFTVNSGVTAAINALTIQNGSTANSALGGDGIYNNGTLTVTNSTFSGNAVTSSNGGIGGGIYNDSGTLRVTNTNFSSNSTTGNGNGGGIASFATFGMATLAVTNSAFSTNSAGDGGGIYNGSRSTATVTSSIFSSNSA